MLRTSWSRKKGDFTLGEIISREVFALASFFTCLDATVHATRVISKNSWYPQERHYLSTESKSRYLPQTDVEGFYQHRTPIVA